MRSGAPPVWEARGPCVAPPSGSARPSAVPLDVLADYLAACKDLVQSDIERIALQGGRRSALHDLVLDYPRRSAKALRPALCIAACRALGGRVDDVLPTAAVLELYHNAFLIHDDIEDGSLLRRGEPTLHEAHGVPIALNVGDAMLALALEPLLENTRVIGLGKALRVMRVVARMARVSSEGQAAELAWIRDGRWDLSERDYLRMVHDKTAHYTFVAPVLAGALIAGADPMTRSLLRRFAALLGVAFQIRDDLLNVTAPAGAYGKEAHGDLWEGKRTLMLIHLFRAAEPAARERAERILARPRAERTPADVDCLLEGIRATAAIPYAEGVAAAFATKAGGVLRRLDARTPPSVHRDFLHALLEYTVSRDR